MKFSELWLRSFVAPPLATDQLAHALTMAGLEVEAIEAAGQPFTGVVVGEIISLERHPNADRLNVCQVNAGGDALLQVVCGAPNARAGLKAPLAQIGASLPGLQIKASKLRGVESQGMLCSATELGVSEDGSGLLELPKDAPVGVNFREYWQLDDALLTLKLTPNRGDCLSILGIAREVAAISGAPMTLPAFQSPPILAVDRRNVSLGDPGACPLYCGRVVKGINPAAKTPRWIVSRLERSGLRSISPVVDATNYVMLELGQPMHAFDLAKLQGEIQVRFGRMGERLVVLNGQEIEITPDLLVIADNRGPVALAGVMGGLESGVSENTTDLFLEAAYFEPAAIAGRSRRLGFNSDAAHRFERGVDFGATERAMERLTEIVLEICGGQAGPVTVARDLLPARPAVSVRLGRVNRILGIALTEDQVASVLKRLELPFSRTADGFQVTPPTHRFDLEIEEDLIEEVGRIHGYDAIPAALPKAEQVVTNAGESIVSDAQFRSRLAARGYQEVITFSFVPRSWESDFAELSDPITLANPIASQLEAMRSQLFGSLVDCLRQNLNRRRDRVRIFELGRVFSRDGTEGFRQPLKLGGLAYGNAFPEQWGMAARSVDYFDVKGDVNVLIDLPHAVYVPAAHPAFHPGKSAEIRLDGQPIGWIGELHPKWMQAYELPQSPVLFEVDLNAVRGRTLPRFSALSRQPMVTRDLAVVVSEGVSAGDLLSGLLRDRPAIVQDVVLFDLYRGKGVENGEKSLAFRVLLQDTQKTLTDADVDAALSVLLERVRRDYHGRLRD